LQSSSSAIDNGALSAAYQKFYDQYKIDISKDINGISRPIGAGWDIGAYEYKSSQACVRDVDCADDNYCNGIEKCQSGKCISGSNPCKEDLYYCIAVSCDEQENACKTIFSHLSCNDNDPCTKDICIGSFGDSSGCKHEVISDCAKSGGLSLWMKMDDSPDDGILDSSFIFNDAECIECPNFSATKGHDGFGAYSFSEGNYLYLDSRSQSLQKKSDNLSLD
jgi:hypothetical protein